MIRQWQFKPNIKPSFSLFDDIHNLLNCAAVILTAKKLTVKTDMVNVATSLFRISVVSLCYLKMEMLSAHPP